VGEAGKSEVKQMGTMKLTLEIPGEILNAVRLPPKEMEHEFRKELALALYRREALSFGKARLLAQMTCWEFEELLDQRNVTRHYADADLEEDIEYGLGGE
jgi:predicted HTH domain antitoxin